MSKFDIRFCLGLVFCDIRLIGNHQLIGFTPIDEQVNISQEVRKIPKRVFIGIEFGMVAAAIYGDVDCVDYISH